MQDQEQPNRIIVNTKDEKGKITTITLNLADDKKEVRGFGQLIYPQTAKQMALSYFKDYTAAWKVIETIDSDTSGKYDDLKSSDFDSLKKIINPDNQTVSGVFGKEIILQILSQRDCEGIRYILGTDNNLNTVILLGVEQVQIDGNDVIKKSVAQSQPLKQSAFSSDMPSDEDPAIGEVHENSLTISGVKEMMAKENHLFQNPESVIFGAF